MIGTIYQGLSFTDELKMYYHFIFPDILWSKFVYFPLIDEETDSWQLRKWPRSHSTWGRQNSAPSPYPKMSLLGYMAKEN